MQITLMITEKVLQFVMTPESKHEQHMLQALQGYDGPAEVKPGVQIADTKARYLRDFGSSDRSVAVVIRKAEPEDL